MKMILKKWVKMLKVSIFFHCTPPPFPRKLFCTLGLTLTIMDGPLHHVISTYYLHLTFEIVNSKSYDVHNSCTTI